MNPENFFSELKRRNVYKVAVAYAVVGWVIAQIATQIFPFLEIPNWIVRLVIVLIAIGFPIALIIAWAFEATPEGIKRTEVADAMPTARSHKRHAWIFVVIVGAALSVGLFFIGRYTARNGTPRQSEAATTLPQKSIAVLPFDNLSRDPDNAYFAEGVQDEILTRLAKVADLKVISRTSTQRFKSAPSDLREIAKQLGVMHIVEGSVQKANDQVRVNVQLINAMTDAHLWADTYDRKLIDIFSVESEIAKTIADTLQVKLTGSEKQMMAAQPTTDTTAYELYHKGRSLWERRSGDNIPKAISFYEQAIAIIGAGMEILSELRPNLEDPAAAGLRTRKFLGTEEDNLPTKHTKHPKEEKPVLPFLVFRVFGGQKSPLLQRLHDPESRLDQDQDQEHEQDAVIVDPKVVACFTDTHIAQMLGYLNITGLDLALLLNFKNARLEWKRVLRPREAGEHDTPDLHG